MKTPRHLLFQRHAHAEARLNRVRETALASVAQSDVPRLMILLRKPWEELFWPARKIWTGFAVVWILLLAVNFADSETAFLRAEPGKPVPDAFIVCLRQQRLAEQSSHLSRMPDAEPSPSGTPGPRTHLPPYSLRTA